MKGLECHLAEGMNVSAQELSHGEYNRIIGALTKHPYLAVKVGEISGNPPPYKDVTIWARPETNLMQRMQGFNDIVATLNASIQMPEGSINICEDIFKHLPPKGILRIKVSNTLNNMGVNTYDTLIQKYKEFKGQYGAGAEFSRFMKRRLNFGNKSFDYFKGHLVEVGLWKHFE